MSCRVWLSILLLALIAGCGHDHLATPGTAQLTPLFSSDTSGVSIRATSGELVIHFDKIPSDGVFFAVPLNAASVTSEQWQGDDQLLHLAIPHQGQLELGIYPLRGYMGFEATARIQISLDARTTSTPPLGNVNKVSDLTVTELAPGQVRLSWTEVNTGDYSIDGIVNLQDLAPLGMYFGLTSSDPGWDVVRTADGNNDGQIGLADLSPIGANYYSEVAGYVVKREIPGDPPTWQPITTLMRGPFEKRPYPPHYVFDTAGAPDDLWLVAPVDSNNAEGVSSYNATLDRIDIVSSVSFSGSDLWLFDDGVFGPSALNKYLMRVLLPIDNPGRTPIVPPIGTMSDPAQFNGLPRQTRLLLDYVYAPVIDPATGDNTAPEFRLITSVPFELPAEEQAMQLSADIQLVQNILGHPAFWVDSYVTQVQLGLTRHTRQDLYNNLVACDTTEDNGFTDEAWLYDSDNDGVSDALLRRQQQYNSYVNNGTGQAQDVVLTAVVKSTNIMSIGILGLESVYEIIPAEPFPLYQPVDAKQLYFSEQTNFAELHFAGTPGEYESNFDPSTLKPTDSILVHGVRLILTNPLPEQPEVFWADRILRKVNE